MISFFFFCSYQQLVIIFLWWWWENVRTVLFLLILLFLQVYLWSVGIIIFGHLSLFLLPFVLYLCNSMRDIQSTIHDNNIMIHRNYLRIWYNIISSSLIRSVNCGQLSWSLSLSPSFIFHLHLHLYTLFTTYQHLHQLFHVKKKMNKSRI